MLSRHDPPARLLELAAAQGQVLLTSQCEDLSFSRSSVHRLVGQGLWTRLVPGLVHTGSGKPDWLGLAWGGVLLGGPNARIGGTAAGHLYGLVPEAPLLITINTDRQMVRNAPWWLFERERGRGRSKSRGAPPRLSIEDTVLDLCADPTQLENVIMAAISGRLTTPERLWRQADRRGRVPQGPAVRRLLRLTAQGVHSHLEKRFLTDIEQAHGLPRGTRQRSVIRGAVVDVVYDEFRVIIEIDGRAGHEGTGAFRDMHRDNDHLVAGYDTLRFGYSDIVQQPCEVASMIAEVLRQRGWRGGNACRRCRACS